MSEVVPFLSMGSDLVWLLQMSALKVNKNAISSRQDVWSRKVATKAVDSKS